MYVRVCVYVRGTQKTSSFLSHSFCPPLSLGLHPSVPAPQLWSFHHFYLSLVCCAFSPHRFTSSLPLCPPTSPFPLCAFLPLLFSFNKPHSCTPRSLHRATSPWLHPFSPPLPLPLPPSPPVLLRVIMHHAISYQFVILYFLLGIHNPLHISPSVFCSLWPAFHLLNYLAFIGVPVFLSVSRMLMPQSVFVAVCAVSI